MEIQEFKFIYNDLKQQVKQQPPLQNLLRLTQKSTKKLQCLNLYSITDKRDFDLQLQQQQILQKILQLSIQIKTLKQSPIKSQKLLSETIKKIQEIKNKNILIFDLLNRQDELLSQEIQIVQYQIGDEQKNDQFGGNIKIKQQDQFQYEHAMKESGNTANHEQLNRIDQLKRQITEIGAKIAKINNGRGKWFVTDHNDFVKIYNKCAGNGKKIIEESIKVLGMKSTQIMDHLQLYENYLQLQKEKKIISEEYKQIKMYQKIEESQKIQQQKKLLDQKKKVKKEKQIEQNQKKKQLIQKFKDKKQQQKIKLMQQNQKMQKQKVIKIPLPPCKKKQIIERNQKYISEKQANFKKTQDKIQSQHPHQEKSSAIPNRGKSNFLIQKQLNQNKKNSRSLIKQKKVAQSPQIK